MKHPNETPLGMPPEMARKPSRNTGTRKNKRPAMRQTTRKGGKC